MQGETLVDLATFTASLASEYRCLFLRCFRVTFLAYQIPHENSKLDKTLIHSTSQNIFSTYPFTVVLVHRSDQAYSVYTLPG